MRIASKTERNAAIVAAWQAGASWNEIARTHDVSLERARQVVGRHAIQQLKGAVEAIDMARAILDDADHASPESMRDAISTATAVLCIATRGGQ